MRVGLGTVLARVQRGLYLRQVTCQNDHAILAEIHCDATKIHENGPTPPSCTHLEHQVPAEAGGGECAGAADAVEDARAVVEKAQQQQQQQQQLSGADAVSDESAQAAVEKGAMDVHEQNAILRQLLLALDRLKMALKDTKITVDKHRGETGDAGGPSSDPNRFYTQVVGKQLMIYNITRYSRYQSHKGPFDV